MSQTLYRKYRPQTFKELIGQAPIKLTLQNEIKSGQLAHAFLFTGPRGVGKTTTARLLAKALNCQSPRGTEPCNQCSSCLEIIRGQSLDVIEIDAASHTQVDHVRENIIPNARTSPTHLKYKIFIIDEVHMLSLSAFNALLKIIEEPPAKVIFILATTEVHKLPETVISRCQRFDFKRVGTADIVGRLKTICLKEGIEVEDEVLTSIALMAEGSIRDAESTLGQIFSLGEKKITRSAAELVLPRSDFKLIFLLFSHLIEKKVKESIETVNNMVNEGVNIKSFVDQFIEFLRKAILIKIDPKLEGLSYFEADQENEKKFRALLDEVAISDLKRLIDIFLKYRREIDSGPIPQLPLEMLIIELGPPESRSEEDSPPPSPAKKLLEKTKAPLKKEAKEKSQSAKAKPEIVEKAVSKWPEIIRKVNEDNHSLALVLKNCLPFSLESNNLVIGCPFSFHQEKMSEVKNTTIIEKIINKVLGERLRISFKKEEIVFPVNKKKEKEEKEQIADLLESFGGEVL